MIDLTLLRLGSKEATRGVLIHNGEPSWTTLEPVWLDNKRHISCIPEGGYTCVRVKGRRLHSGQLVESTFELIDVLGRDGILFHVGNFVSNTEGCILLGQGFKYLGDSPMITDSETAFNTFLRAITDDKFRLIIKSL